MEFNSIENSDFQPEEVKRPTLLTVLCVLSFISIGFSFLGNFSALLSGPLPIDELEKVIADSMNLVARLQDAGSSDLSKTLELVIRTQEYINSNFYPHTLITLIGLITGFIGVFFMFKGRKNGFHFYIVYNILSIVGIYVSVPASEVPTIMIVSNMIFSAIFILLYSRNLSWMKN
jgi:hypothetical protein